MADDSRDPADNIDVTRIVGALEGVTGRLTAALKEGQALVAEAEALVAEARRGRTGVAPAAGPTALPSEPRARIAARAAGQVRSDSEATVRSEARITEQLAHQARLLDYATKVRRAGGFADREDKIREAASALARPARAPISAPVSTAEAAERVRAAVAAEQKLRVAAARGLPVHGPVIDPDPRALSRQRAVGDLRAGQIAAGQDPGRVARDAADAQSRKAIETLGAETDARTKLQAVKRSELLLNTDLARSASLANQNAALATDIYTRRGAMTTEFITAAAKGQVTIQELGRQVALTIGKFAGWTLAASAVYGVARAVGVLGQGAIQSLDAVNKLSRVAPGLDKAEAQGRLRDAATKFNLPLDEVGEAAFASAKTFKGQEDIFKGTEAALFAVKVGELDAATAGATLTSIINGIGGSASDLLPILDTVNNLTNNFGGNVGLLLQGLSKSAGAFTNAGGSMEYLTSLLEVGARTTSYTANEIGTAYSRISARLQTPVGRGRTAELLGISEDDAGDVEKVIETIFQRVREGASNQQIALFAQTIATPNLAARIIPTLKSESLFRTVRGEATREESRGSAERELRRVKGAASEQLRAATIALGNLGSALATSGVVEPLLAMAKALVLVIRAATELIGVFGKLPDELKVSVALFAEIAAAVALLKRFDVGGVIARSNPAIGTLGLQRNPERLERTNVLQGFDTERKFLQERRRTAEIESRLAFSQADSSKRAAQKIRDLHGIPNAVKDVDLPDHLDEANMREYNRHVTRANRSVRVGRDLFNDAADALERDIVVAGEAKGVRRDTSILRAGARMTTQESVAAREIEGFRPEEQKRSSSTVALPIVAGGVREGLEEAEKAQQAAQTEARRTTRQAVRTGVIARTAGAAWNAGAVAVRGAGAGLQVARGGMSAMRFALAGLFGPLELLVAGAFATYQVVKGAKEQFDEAERLSNLAKREADPKVLRAAAKKELADKSIFDRVASFALHGPLLTRVFSDVIGAKTPDEVADEIARKKLLGRDAPRRERQQAKGKLLETPQILKNLRDRINDADSAAEKEAAIARGYQELEDSFLKSKPKIGVKGKLAVGRVEDTLRQARAAVEDGSKTLQQRLNLLQTAAEFGAFRQGIENKIKQEGFTGKTAKVLAADAATLRRQAAAVKDPEGKGEGKVAELLAEAEAAEALIIDEADKKLKQQLAAARTPQEAGRATRAYVSTLRARLDSQRRQHGVLRGQTARDTVELAEQRAAQEIDTTRLRSLGPTAVLDRGPVGDDARRLIKTITDRKTRIGVLTQRITTNQKYDEQLRKQLGLSQAAFAELRRAAQRAQFDLEQAARDADTAVAVSETADPLEAARITGRNLHANVEGLRGQLALHQAKRAEVQEAIAKENENLKQIAQAELARAESRRSLATSRFMLTNPSDDAIASHNVAMARAALADAQRRRSRLDPGTLMDLETKLNEAIKARADQIRQTAQDLIVARSESDQSKTDDPVAQAKIRAVAAKRLEKYARGAKERINAATETRNAEKEIVAARISKASDDIDFNLEMERISTDTAISQYRALLKLRGVNAAQKKDILRKIHALEGDEGDFDLKLANIKLPTAYEIRRAVTGGVTAARQANMAQTNYVTLNVQPGSEMLTAEVIDRTMNMSTRGALRSSRG